MLPYPMLYGMRIIIEKKNYSPAITYLHFDKQRNTFTGTDWFVILEYTPQQIVPISYDFWLTWNQIKALEAMITPLEAVSVRWTHKTSEGKELIEFSWGGSSLFIEWKTKQDLKFPEVNRKNLFGDESTLNRIATSYEMEKFIKVWKKINPSWIATSHEKAIVLEHEDSVMQARYHLSITKIRD